MITTAPVRKTVTVALGREEAFELFTSGIARWWPLATHSINGTDAETCVFEGRVGGRIYERSRSGDELGWGRVKVWDPPHRVVFSWLPSLERQHPTDVEVRFESVDGGTRVDLEHRGWERVAEEAPELRDSYIDGWTFVLDRFVGATG